MPGTRLARWRRSTTGAVVATLALVCVAEAEARSSYCSPSGDWCTSVGRGGDARKLSLASFAFGGGYRLCVRPPSGRQDCHAFRLRRSDGLWSSKVTWRRHFPVRGRGRYRVRFFHDAVGGQLGPTLSFRR